MKKVRGFTVMLLAAAIVAALAPSALASNNRGHVSPYESWDVIIQRQTHTEHSDHPILAIHDRSDGLLFDANAFTAMIDHQVPSGEYDFRPLEDIAKANELSDWQITDNGKIIVSIGEIASLAPKRQALTEFLDTARFRHDISYFNVKNETYCDLPTALEIIDENYELVRLVPLRTLANFADASIVYQPRQLDPKHEATIIVDARYPYDNTDEGTPISCFARQTIDINFVDDATSSKTENINTININGRLWVPEDTILAILEHRLA